MPHYRYLIIGGGMAADSAIQAIRAGKPDSSIGLISMETNPPYDRPPLTKGLWKDDSVEDIWRNTNKHEVNMHLGRTVQYLDPDRRLVIDDQGTEYLYNRLLLATGGTPKQLPFHEGSDHNRVIYYRTLADYQHVQQLAEQGSRFAVIGGGFIGSEIAAALAINDNPVVMLFPEAGIGASRFPPGLSQFLNDYYAKKGVEVLANQTVSDWDLHADHVVLYTQQGREIEVDAVVAGLGIEPNSFLAKTAGLDVDNGILVDEFLRTSHPDIYAAGDVANFYNPMLDKRLRVEHEDNADMMGQIAGRNMADDPVAYDHLPFFYSDLFDLGYEAIGKLDSTLKLVEDWQEEPYQKGVVYYLQNDQVQGALAWNVWDKMEAARSLMSEARVDAQDLPGKLNSS